MFFDLPVTTQKNRKDASDFRKFLLRDGYHMLQYSVYARVCNGMDAVEKHRARLKQHLPNNGAIRLLVITEKQFESIDILLGALTMQGITPGTALFKEGSTWVYAIMGGLLVINLIMLLQGKLLMKL